MPDVSSLLIAPTALMTAEVKGISGGSAETYCIKYTFDFSEVPLVEQILCKRIDCLVVTQRLVDLLWPLHYVVQHILEVLSPIGWSKL